MSSDPERRVSEQPASAEQPASGQQPAPTERPAPTEQAASAEEPALGERGVGDVALRSGEGIEDERHGEILAALAELSRRLDREHERAAHRERVIDRLHEENQALRRGELQAALDPVRACLYRLHDLVRREARRLAGQDGGAGAPEPAHTAALLAAVADEVADALAHTGVHRFTVEPGEPHDAERHRPVAAEPVGDTAAVGTVVAVRCDGFERDGRVVRKAETVVGKAPDGESVTAGSPAADTVASGRSSAPHGNGRGETMKPGP